MANRTFEVITVTITVAIWLRLKSLDWTMKTGLRYPGEEPVGADKVAYQMSPRLITMHHPPTRRVEQP